MSEQATEILFIQGPPKTATSTLVGILNCHPDILMLYETMMGQELISKYGAQLLQRFPRARSFFRDCSDLGLPYRDFAEHLRHGEGRHYRYLGDKLITFNSDETYRHRVYKTIYPMRDIRTWLCKGAIVQWYRTDLDVVPVAIAFARYLIRTHSHPNCLRIRVEDLVARNDQVLSALSSFLALDVSAYAQEWWSKIGIYSTDDPKSALHWAESRVSARVKPEQVDTHAEIVPGPFWEELLPIVSKYYDHEPPKYSQEEINADLEGLEQLTRYSPLPLEKCFHNVSTQRILPKLSLFARWHRFKNRTLRRIHGQNQTAAG